MTTTTKKTQKPKATPVKTQVATPTVTESESDTNHMLAVKQAIDEARKKYGTKVVLAWEEVDAILKSIEGALK